MPGQMKSHQLFLKTLVDYFHYWLGKSWIILWFFFFFCKRMFIWGYGFRGLIHDGRTKARQQESWEITSWSKGRGQRENTGNSGSHLKPQNPSTMTRPPKGCTFLPSTNSSTNWRWLFRYMSLCKPLSFRPPHWVRFYGVFVLRFWWMLRLVS